MPGVQARYLLNIRQRPGKEIKVTKKRRTMNTSKSSPLWLLRNELDYPADPDEEREIWLESDGEDENNQIITHNHRAPTPVELPCACDGCKRRFRTVLYPEQVIYPRYCENHRRKNTRNSAGYILNGLAA